MTGKELVEQCARRAAGACEQMAEDNKNVSCPTHIEREFAPFARLYEAAQHSREMDQITPALCVALAEVEKTGKLAG